jgi:hypothetical protein
MPTSSRGPAGLALLLALAGAACAPPEPAPTGKPAPPLDLQVTTRSLGGAEHEVTVAVTATRDLGALELTVDGRPARFAATSAGQARVVSLRLRAPAEGRDVVAVARAGGRSRAAVVRLGAPAAPPPAPGAMIVLPDGTVVAEVR